MQLLVHPHMFDLIAPPRLHALAGVEDAVMEMAGESIDGSLQ